MVALTGWPCGASRRLARSRRGPGLVLRAVILPGRRLARAHRQDGGGGDAAIRSNPATSTRWRSPASTFAGGSFPRERRDHLRHAEALGRAQAGGARWWARLSRRPRAIKEGAGVRLQPAADLRPGTAGGFEFYIQNRGEGGPRACWPRRAAVHRRRRRRAPSCMPASTPSGAPHVPQLYVDVDREKAKARACRSTTCSTRCRDARQLLRQRLQQVRPHLAGADVQADAPYPREPDDVGDGLRAQREGRDGADVRCARSRASSTRPRHARPLQQPARRSRCWAGPPGVSSGQAIARSSGSRPRCCRRLQPRLERRLVPGEARRRHLGPGARARRGDGVPDPRRAVREAGRCRSR